MVPQFTCSYTTSRDSTLVDALRSWKRRYKALETHHTEELCYVDECEDGFSTLVAQLSADSRRIVWRVEISFQLRGVPLDTGPYRELCDHFGLSDPVYFRPRKEESRIFGRPSGKLPVVKPVAHVVDVERIFPDDDEWVAGIVVENPFFLRQEEERVLAPDAPAGDEGVVLVEVSPRRRNRVPKWVPHLVTDSQYLVCALRSWHTLDNPKPVYELWDFESAWTSNALVVRALADWPDEPGDDVPTPASGRGGAEVHRSIGE
jgi:hypothetical protein